MNRTERLALAVLLVVAGGLLVAGWRVFWFLTDDAFIAFRYVSNSHLGHGYVWNPPPFRPVEGYTSFLWVVLLDLAWRALGISPPEIANRLSLFFAFLALLLAAVMVLRLRLRAELRRSRLLLLALVLLGVTTNRTFLTWASSGFETAMFNFFVLAWVYVCFYVPLGAPLWVLALCMTTAFLELTRPDGLLFAAATAGILSLVRRGAISRSEPAPRLRLLSVLACLPLLAVPAHLVWRRATYGAWLPNTYHAKVVGIWPASGVRYAASFVLEYALWLWLGLLVVVGLQWFQRRRKDMLSPAASVPSRIVRCICLSTLAVHVLYYTFVLGGDHFEYRVYSHLVVPFFVSSVWLLERAPLGARAAVAVLTAFVLLQQPVAWSHWALSRRLTTRQQTKPLRVALAPHWPGPVRWYAQAYDGLQFWLIGRWVCVRHQEHKVNQEYLVSLYSTRTEGEKLPRDGFPVHAFQAVGVASWTLPLVNILDLLGLNDPVIARNPVDPRRFRGMAHQREPPPGYVECFRPNVFLAPGGGVRVVARDPPLTEEAIRECERHWAEAVRR